MEVYRPSPTVPEQRTSPEGISAEALAAFSALHRAMQTIRPMAGGLSRSDLSELMGAAGDTIHELQDFQGELFAATLSKAE